MKLASSLAIIAVAALALATAAAEQQATVSIEARTNALVPGSSEGVTKTVAIPPTCTYVSHHVDVLERKPEQPASGDRNDPTSFSTALSRDAHGRVDAVKVTVVARVPESLQSAAIGVRLSVVMRCD